MKIDKIEFQSKFKTLAGYDFSKQIPDTHEELLLDQNDPDEFNSRTVFILDIVSKLNHTAQTITLPTVFTSGLTDKVMFGNVVINGNITIDSSFVVIGNLTVSGVIFSSEHSNLLVSGNISCKAMLLCCSYWLVLGSIKCELCSYCMAYGFIMIRNEFHTTLHCQDETWVVCHENQDPLQHESSGIEYIICDNKIVIEASSPQEMRSLLETTFPEEKMEFDEDGEWCYDIFFELLMEHNK